MHQLYVAVFLALVLAVSSSPLGDDCTVSSYSQVANAVKKCSNLVINSLTVPSGKALELNLKTGASVKIKGTITFEVGHWAGPLVVVSGTKVTVDGSGATFDGQGAKYWDGKGSGGVKKPKFFRVKTKGGSVLNHIKLLNCPVHCVSINSASDTTLDGWVLDVSAGDAGNKGHNTDGFDVSSSSNIIVKNAIVKNQDDCVAVNQGSNLQFNNLQCSGGHGLSLSVGQSSKNGEPNTVKNVTFSGCTVKNSRNGIHVKTHSDAGTGLVSDVTYKNIALSGITHYGINVQQDYQNGKSSGNPKGNIPIKGLTLNHVTGSMSGDKNGMPVYILCGSGGCSGWKWSDVSINNGKKSNQCNFTPQGFKCGNKGHNTDGFDVSSSSNIIVKNAIVKNQDDCVAVNQGSNLQFNNLQCSGGHGLSLSVGQSSKNGEPNTVKNVTFSGCTVKNSRNGIHVKTHSDAGTGLVSDVTYKNIALSGITHYGINVQQDYQNGKSSGNPKGNIPIKGLTLNHVTGSMSEDKNGMPVYILCGSGGCSGWKWSDISINNGKKSNQCNFTPQGFKC